jgi:hypothetical protein
VILLLEHIIYHGKAPRPPATPARTPKNTQEEGPSSQTPAPRTNDPGLVHAQGGRSHRSVHTTGNRRAEGWQSVVAVRTETTNPQLRVGVV